MKRRISKTVLLCGLCAGLVASASGCGFLTVDSAGGVDTIATHDTPHDTTITEVGVNADLGDADLHGACDDCSVSDSVNTQDLSGDTLASPQCGNAKVEAGEACETSVLAAVSCASLSSYYSGGTATCSNLCTWDLTKCQLSEPVCGDGVLQAGENCDPLVELVKSCTDFGALFVGGNALCTHDCNWDYADCVRATALCGNGVVEGGEECDGPIGGDHEACSDDCRLMQNGQPVNFEPSSVGQGDLSAAFMYSNWICADADTRAGWHTQQTVTVRYRLYICVDGNTPAQSLSAARDVMSKIANVFQSAAIVLEEESAVDLEWDGCVIDYDSETALFAKHISKQTPSNIVPIVFVKDIVSAASLFSIGGYSGPGHPVVCTTPSTTIVAHELGHKFGLSHTHDCSLGKENSTNCSWAGDMLCDTPPDHGPQGTDGLDTCADNSQLNGTCSCNGKCGGTGTCTTGEAPDCSNIMSYYHCWPGDFSDGQKDFMRCSLNHELAEYVDDCVCSGGDCCDGCNYRPSSYKCDSAVQTEYSCQDGTACGQDVFVRYQDRFCSGSSNSCSGTLKWTAYSVHDDCTSSETCANGDASCNATASCDCQCTSGDCCDGCNYRPSSHKCNSAVQTEYSCQDGTACGQDVFVRYQDKYCSGSSNSCSGTLKWTAYSVHDNCTSSETCANGDPSCNSTASCDCQCTSGDCCDGCNYRPSSYKCDSAVQTEYSCQDGTACGKDVFVRYQDKYCSGSSNSCSGTLKWTDYSVHDNCTSSETCANGDTSCNATASCDCQCTSGDCCDGCNYRPSSYKCDSAVQTEYSCQDGTACGKDVFVRYQDRFCTGSGSSCSGTLKWTSYSVHDNCTSSEKCADDDSSCNYSSSCVAPTDTIYDGCTGSNYSSSCTSSCESCKWDNGFVGYNESGCSGATCFLRYPNAPNNGFVIMYTRSTQTAYARWEFGQALSGTCSISAYVPSYSGQPNPYGCTSWKPVTDVVYNIKKGSSTYTTQNSDHSYDKGSWKLLYSGNCTGITGVTVGNKSSQTNCNVILLDAVKVSQ